jgi:hypothetical protein
MKLRVIEEDFLESDMLKLKEDIYSLTIATMLSR